MSCLFPFASGPWEKKPKWLAAIAGLSPGSAQFNFLSSVSFLQFNLGSTGEVYVI